ncbi:MFS transporter [Curtobacterium sp. S6]|uniref:MFS transporter n=1 Tax=Curtobacterium sp. S6 TaxID=1479623 RepID=UPI0004AB06E2|nr:MFS transporter [Curtobacterium sp. S6]
MNGVCRPKGSLIAILLGFFIVMLDTTIVNVALARVGFDLHMSVASLQWVIDAYTLVFAAFLLTAGAACDRIGARKVYVTGLLVFAVFSAACALAPTGGYLVAGRVLQGLGAAAIVPASLALLSAVYEDPEKRARAIGLWGGAGGVAAAIGPVLGGALVSVIGWRAVFWVNIPVIAVGCRLTLRALPGITGSRKRRMDLPGQALSVLGFGGITYAVITAGEYGWSAWQSLDLVAGAVFLAIFVYVERRHPAPMLPMDLFGRVRFSVAAVVGFALNLSFFGQLFVLSLFFQRYLGYEPWLAGLALAPQACSAVIGSPLGGRAVGRWGAFPTMLIGLMIGTIGFGSLVLLTAETPFVLLAILTFAVGFGMAFAMPAATTAAVSSALPQHVGIAGGVINAARQTGSLVGVAVLGAMVARGPFLSGFHTAAALAGAVFGGGALLVAVILMRDHRQVRLRGRL